jgi:quinoprotein glucose dehydrogenase
LKSGQIPEELQLDVFVSASKQKEPGLRELISQWTNSLSATDSLGVRRTVLHGGNAAKGRRLFAERADLGCQRCHKLKGEGGDVGPELTGLAKSKGREYILQSLLDPNSAIATGFESVLIETKDGNSILGILKSETEKELQIQSADAGLLHVLKSEIQSRQRGPSAMPDGLTELMSLHELRDLIEALSE